LDSGKVTAISLRIVCVVSANGDDKVGGGPGDGGVRSKFNIDDNEDDGGDPINDDEYDGEYNGNVSVEDDDDVDKMISSGIMLTARSTQLIESFAQSMRNNCHNIAAADYSNVSKQHVDRLEKTEMEERIHLKSKVSN
jgi:hypothetical protein